VVVHALRLTKAGRAVTALELVAQGVVFSRARARVKVLAPKGRADLVETLRLEVARRVPKLGGQTMARDLTQPRGRCETCGDPMKLYLAGMCDLCVAARGKALEKSGTRPTW
jgi:hypothetical protein